MVLQQPLSVREQLLLIVDHLGAGSRNGIELLCELDGIAGAGLFAHAAVDTAQHVDLEDLRSLVPVLPGGLLGDDIDAIRWADCLAHEAGDAFFPSKLIDLQAVFAAEPGPHLLSFFRILDGKGLVSLQLQDMQQGVEESLCHRRQVQEEAPAPSRPFRLVFVFFGHLRSHPVSVSRETTIPVNTMFSRARGTKAFQPSFMSWS